MARELSHLVTDDILILFYDRIAKGCTRRKIVDSLFFKALKGEYMVNIRIGWRCFNFSRLFFQRSGARPESSPMRDLMHLLRTNARKLGIGSGTGNGLI